MGTELENTTSYLLWGFIYKCVEVSTNWEGGNQWLADRDYWSVVDAILTQLRWMAELGVIVGAGRIINPEWSS